MQAQVEPCLASANPRIVACGILGVFSYGLEDRREAALGHWQSLLADARTSSVSAALQLGQKLPMPASFLPLVGDLLEHTDDGVKKAALAALRHGGLTADTRLTALLAALAKSPEPQMRVACIECCRLLPAAERERLAFAALTDRHPNVVNAALGVLEECVEDLPARLFAWLDEGRAPPRQQQQVLTYLSRQAVPRQPFEEFAGRKLQDAAAMAQALHALEADASLSDAGSTLTKIVLAERFTQTWEVALLAMENLGDSYSVRIVHVALKTKDSRQVARAREALSNIAHTALGAQLGQLLMVAGDHAAVADMVSGTMRFNSATDALQWCGNHVDSWLRECAQHVLAAAPAEGQHG